MSKSNTLKPLAIALGAAFTTSLAMAPSAQAAENPFAMTELSSGYKVASMEEGKCGAQMKEKAKEGKCGEGKCGAKMKEKAKEGKCGAQMKEKAKEGKCGEGKCGSRK